MFNKNCSMSVVGGVCMHEVQISDMLAHEVSLYSACSVKCVSKRAVMMPANMVLTINNYST